MSTPRALTTTPASTTSVIGRVVPIMVMVAVAYLVTGIAMPVLPIYVHQGLGLSTFVVGVVAGTQFAATLISRLWAGRYADERGPKAAVIAGLVVAVAAGLLYLFSMQLAQMPSTSLVVLLAGPALLGVMESFVITGALSWGLARAGTQHHLQQSRSAIPKSVKPAWIAEHFDIFDFELSSGELTAIGRARHRRARRPSTRDNHARAIRPADPRGMSRIFITGSTDGLGRAAARALIDEGHHVVLHARSRERAAAVGDLAARSAGVVVGDLSSAAETRSVAEQVNAIGRMDAVIHNAGTYSTSGRSPTPEGHAAILAVNTLAPYMLTALIERPNRLIYLSSGMHRGGVGSLRDIDWTERRWNSSQAYSDSKLYVTALAFAVARCWPDVLSNAVDPGWVPTKMGGRGAPDDFDEGYLTQTWLAVSDDPAATVSGHYWHHRRRQTAAREASDPRFQDQLSARLAELTGVQLF